ncbi:unnamed protein product [Amoebophrya sp. A25]|nr:unnamed protein product [Amoebophrya sp. A25]|eukprot:GSA25T00009033001.1
MAQRPPGKVPTGKVNGVMFLPNVYTIQSGPKIIEMVLEVVNFFEIHVSPEDFCNRCVDCNASDWQLVTDKSEVRDDVMPHVYENQEIFYRCGECKKVYWEGQTFDRACADLEQHFPHLGVDDVRGVKAEKLLVLNNSVGAVSGAKEVGDEQGINGVVSSSSSGEDDDGSGKEG